jgi:hypothetical protein
MKTQTIALIVTLVTIIAMANATALVFQKATAATTAGTIENMNKVKTEVSGPLNMLEYTKGRTAPNHAPASIPAPACVAA